MIPGRKERGGGSVMPTLTFVFILISLFLMPHSPASLHSTLVMNPICMSDCSIDLLKLAGSFCPTKVPLGPSTCTTLPSSSSSLSPVTIRASLASNVSCCLYSSTVTNTSHVAVRSTCITFLSGTVNLYPTLPPSSPSSSLSMYSSSMVIHWSAGSLMYVDNVALGGTPVSFTLAVDLAPAENSARLVFVLPFDFSTKSLIIFSCALLSFWEPGGGGGGGGRGGAAGCELRASLRCSEVLLHTLK
mmetsp:Transcript_24082/g.60559  ORF Transcript_24082/g.60559 Transcript_24082/m.60559 type:complete len:245 (-) Transcript_24082:113-847(-)